ncbi:hypothetical protein [Legionella fallonii]|uniref:Coiled-coil protein n=1 Tax=Legionella fallonii LLAP-10 TaxID=1212491 RepID=A0A098GB49_9GAMM|nr:hypothetical protein [Legionella fallonii]CEG58696.1 conserved membrane protein of unknown function [Legionella fallonii LLAP-10]
MGNSRISLIKHRFFDKSSKEKNTSLSIPPEQKQTKEDATDETVVLAPKPGKPSTQLPPIAAGNERNTDFSLFKEDDFDLDYLQAEFSSLYQLFISNKHLWVKKEDLVAYMYYLCNLMILYYQYDYVSADLQKLEEKRKAIENFIETSFSKQAQEAIYQLSKELKDRSSISTPSSISIAQIRQYISILNTNRSQWGYSRALASHAIVYIQNNCGTHTDTTGGQCVSTEIISFLDKTREPMAVLGIALFGLRFLINLVLLLKHIIQAAISKELSVKKVLTHEMDKRGFTMSSDFVWATVTLLTTYNIYFQIPTAAISPIVLSFLVFDSLLLITQWAVETAKYNKRLEELMNQEQNAASLEKATIKRQIDLLNDEWETQCAYYLINILAANIIFIAFGVSMFCSGGFILAGMAFLSMLGNALYNTAEEFKKYQQAQIAIRREQANGALLNDEHHQQLMSKLYEQCNQASIEFWKTLAFNVGATAFIITATVISWPVALSLTLTYAAYRLYTNHQSKLEASDKEHNGPNDIYRSLEREQSEEQVLTPCLP